MSNYYCTNNGRECPCNCPMPPQPPQQPQPTPPPAPPTGGCCPCGEDFRQALGLLCGPRLQSLINFSACSFVTDYYVLGSAMEAAASTTAPGDNLAGPAGSYVCGGDSCEALTVSGVLYPPQSAATALESTVTQVALCRLRAISLDAAGSDDTAATNFQTLSQTISQLLRPQRPQPCGNLADALTNAAAIRASTITTGPLVVENSTILGQLGHILVVANSTDNRLYLICAGKIDFMG